MGFQAEKEEQEKKVIQWKRILLLCVLVLFLVLCIISAFCPPDTWQYHFGLPKVGKRKAGEMRLHFVDVGQGDASIIELPDGKIMLIDGGSEEEPGELIRYLNALDIKTIDYLVVTHADADHCGGLRQVVRLFDIKRAFLPNTKVTKNTAYGSFYTALLQTDCRWEYTSRVSQISTSEKYPYTVRFLHPYTIEESTGADDDVGDNEQSAVIWMDYLGVSTLLTADAPYEVEQTLLRDAQLGAFIDAQLNSTEILKVSHHGSNGATGSDFLAYLGVEHAVISCGKGNTYGHPHQAALERLSRAGADVHRTDLHGSIMVNIRQDGKYNVTRLGK